MKRRKTLLLSFALLLTTGLRAQAAPSQSVVVQQVDGTTTEFLLQDDPRIVYRSDRVTLTTETTTLELEASQVARVYFVSSNPTAIDTPVANVRFSIGTSAVNLNGLEPGSTAALYTADGRQLTSASASANGSLSLSLPETSGVLIVKTNNKSFKIINKK